jgi:tryptophan 2,3-dioxygenase
MLKAEQKEGHVAPEQPFTYGDYLRVPELLSLQTPLKEPPAHDEMLFIIAQQAQELWFKQILHELRPIIDLIESDVLMEAVRLLQRVNRILGVMGDEVMLLETMPPQEFQKFRHVLTTSSGLESVQFRELEMASGLNDATFIKVIERFMDVEALRAKWPVSLHDAFCDALARVHGHPVDALVQVYNDPVGYPELYWLAEALSEYETLFSEWRFHHIKLVERTIGDQSPGTAGTSGSGYLGKTMAYKFFPELWEARNRLSRASHE